MTRRLVMLAIATALAVGCKRSRAPKVDEVWDESPAVGQAEALRTLAPPWGSPTHAVLDNGLITQWLHEPDAPTTHVRVLIPTEERDQVYPAAHVAVIEAHLARALGKRTRNRGITVRTRSAPGRIEVALHAERSDTASVLAALGIVLSSRDPSKALDAARTDVVARLERAPSSEDRAIAGLVGRLLQRPAATKPLSAKQVKAVTPAAMLETWQAAVDPRRTVLVVHSGDDAATHREALRQLSDRWRAFGRRAVPPSVLARLRPSEPPTPGDGRILAEPATPLTQLDGPSGSPVLMLGRVIPTPTALDRSLARLAQRVVQEELDARLVLHGDYALFVLRVPLSGNEADERATEAIDALAGLANARQPQQRLFHAAQLWLGARVVQSSLDGEDWTALWSDAIDLAGRDDDIAGALAQDATHMLEVDAETFTAWQRKWLDPRNGQPGWQWLVAGASERDIRRLARIVPVQ